MKGGNNISAFDLGTNRAPFYSDATTSDNVGGLLAAAASKTVVPQYTDADTDTNIGTGIASAVRIVNSSGQTAELTLTVARDLDGKVPDIATNPITLLTGETIEWFKCRVLSIKEKNVGAGTQTGHGVRYLFQMMPTP